MSHPSTRRVKGRSRRVRPPSVRAARPKRASLCAPAAPTGGTAAESVRSVDKWKYINLF